MPDRKSVALTAVVIACNEAHLLDACLNSLKFCDEVVVIDLESKDGSEAVARRYTEKVFSHPRVNHSEALLADLEKFTQATWVLLTDPDELVTPMLARDIRETLDREDLSALSTIRVPWRFRFAGRPLRGTVWGGRRSKGIVHNRVGTVFTGLVHAGRHPAPGFRSVSIPWRATEDNVLEHYWMTGWASLFEKHRRYLKVEGEALARQGTRYSGREHFRATWQALKESLIWKEGWRDGPRGLMLSLFWVWYTDGRWRALNQWERHSGQVLPR
jgi:glycosyltransferase involved in cell wall biosynthesis